MELSEYQAKNIGWLLSDMIDNLDIQNNGIAKAEFAITPQQIYSIVQFLLQFKDEVLQYESITIRNNCVKLNEVLESWD